MRKLIGCVCAGALAVLLTGCMTAWAPAQGGGVLGSVYTDASAPLWVTTNTGATKSGKAMSKSILGLVALGDASIDAACKNGGITKISHVDSHIMSVLGVYGEYTVTVYGE
jgi:ABC-type sugar transport system substrate-binding protein